MRLKSFSTERYAGIMNRNYVFEPGMNVLYGKNETGKSTVVQGIYNSLFRSSKLHKSKDKEFIDLSFPKGGSDTIDATISLCTDDGIYTVSRKWGGSSEQLLTMPNGRRVSSESEISKILADLLRFGSATYRHLVFSSQSEVRDALYSILTDEGIKGEITNRLTKAVMELDGVSIDRLESLIDLRLSEYSGNWDVEAKRPKNNRGVNNPYVKGVGYILRTYYDRELLLRDAAETLKLEKEFEKASSELKSVGERFEKVKKQRKQYEGYDEDIRKRSILEKDLEQITVQSESLKKLIVYWPALKVGVQADRQTMISVMEEIKKLEQELESGAKYAKVVRLQEILKKVEELSEHIAKSLEELKSIPKISADEVKDVSEAEVELIKIGAVLSATQLSAKLETKSDMNITIWDGITDRTEMVSGAEISVGGYLKLEADGLLSFEVRTKDLDIDSIRLRKNQLDSYLNEAKEKFRITDANSALVLLRKIESIEIKVKNLKSQIDLILENKTIEDVKKEIESYRDTHPGRDAALLGKLKQELQAKYREHELRTIVSERELKTYSDKYTDEETAMGMLTELMSRVLEIKAELSKLKTLPPEFKSTDDFFSLYTGLQTEYEKLMFEEFEAKERYNRAERELPEESYEELIRRVEDLNDKFKRVLKTYDSLVKIETAFELTKKRMQTSPMEGLQATMSRYLSIITDDKLKLRQIDETMVPRISNRTAGMLGYKLLSKGSKDSVELALRLSLMEELFKESGSFIIMDDILGDLDEDRKREAIALIREFANRHQVIFNTCDPELARALGGNRIEV